MIWDNMSFDQPREEIVAQGHQMKELTLQFTGTIAFSRAVDMTRIMGQGDDIYMFGIDFDGLQFQSPDLGLLRSRKITKLWTISIIDPSCPKMRDACYITTHVIQQRMKCIRFCRECMR